MECFPLDAELSRLIAVPFAGILPDNGTRVRKGYVMDRRMRMFLYAIILGMVMYWFIFQLLFGARLTQGG